MKELWEMTPKQYMQYRIDQMHKDNGVSKKEIKESFSFGWFYAEFLKILYEAAGKGIRISNTILDRLQKMNREYIIKNYQQHRDYMPPEVRKANKENRFPKTPGRKRK